MSQEFHGNEQSRDQQREMELWTSRFPCTVDLSQVIMHAAMVERSRERFREFLSQMVKSSPEPVQPADPRCIQQITESFALHQAREEMLRTRFPDKFALIDRATFDGRIDNVIANVAVGHPFLLDGLYDTLLHLQSEPVCVGDDASLYLDWMYEFADGAILTFASAPTHYREEVKALSPEIDVDLLSQAVHAGRISLDEATATLDNVEMYRLVMGR